MPHTDLIALSIILAAYAGFEFFLKRMLTHKVVRNGTSLPDRLKLGGLLFGILTLSTATLSTPGLMLGFLISSAVYVVSGMWNAGDRPPGSANRTLEAFLLTQVLTCLSLFATWEIVRPAAVHEWYVGVEQALLAGAPALHNEFHARLPRALLILAGYLFLIDGGTMVVRGLLGKFPRLYARAMASLRGRNKMESMLTVEVSSSSSTPSPTTTTKIATTHTSEQTEDEDENAELTEDENAGEWIGILERILALTFVLTGSYTAIRFAVAAKSLARFKEMEDKNFAEYFLLGTSASLTTAVLTGFVIRMVLAL
jgi:hypothetical protein